MNPSAVRPETVEESAKIQQLLDLSVILLAIALGLYCADGYHAAFAALNPLAIHAPLLWLTLTDMGDTLFALTILLAFPQNPRFFNVCLLTLVIATVLVHGTKWSVDSLRPPAVGTEVVILGKSHDRQSFPSGHSATAFALFALAFLTVHQKFWQIIGLLLTVGIALSRVMVGVHWPIDCLIGAALGILAVLLAIGTQRQFPLPTVVSHYFVAILVICAFFLATQTPQGWPWLYAVTAIAALTTYYSREMIEN